MATELGAAYLTLMPSLRGASGTIKKELASIGVGKFADQSIGKSIASAATGAFGTFAKVGVGAIATVGAAVGGLAIQGGISRALNIEQAQYKFKAMGMDVESTMASCNAAVKGTAYGLDAAATVAANLGASGVQAGDQMTNSLKAVAGVAAMGGASMEDVGRIFGQVAAKGKLQGDELLQFSERGVNATKALADHLGVTQAEVQEMVSAGQIDFQTFSDAMYATFGDAAQGANATFSGAMSNVRAALSRVGASFASPALQGLRDIFVASIPAIDALATALTPVIEKFTEFTSSVSGTVVSALETFTSVLQQTGSPLEAIKAAFDGLPDSVHQFVNAFVKIAGVVGSIAAVATAVSGIKGAVSGIKSAFDGISKAANSFEILRGAITGNSAALSALTFQGHAGAAAVINVARNAATAAASFIAKTAATVADTAASVLNAAASSKVGAAAQSAAYKVLAMASAHKVALAASLGLLAPLIAIGVYMATTGASADEVAAKITDMANNAANAINQFAAAFPGVVEGFTAAFGTIVSAISSQLPGIMTALTSAITAALQAVVTVLPQLLTALIEGFTSMVAAIAQVLPTLVPAIIQGVLTLVTAIAQALPTMLPALITGVTTIITQLAAMLPTLLNVLLPAILSMLPLFVEAFTQLLMAFVQALPQVIEAIAAAIPQIVTAIVGMLPTLIPMLLQAGIQLFMALVQALPLIIPPLIEAIPTVINAVVAMLPTLMPMLLQAAITLFMAIAQAVPQILGALLGAITSLIQSGINHVPTFIGNLGNAAQQLFQEIANAVPRILSDLLSALGSLISSGVSKVSGMASDMASAGADLVRGIADGISGAVSFVTNAISDLCSNALGAVKSFFGIASPSKVMAEMGGFLMAGFAGGITKASGDVMRAMSRVYSDVDDIAAEALGSPKLAYSRSLDVMPTAYDAFGGSVPATATAGITAGRVENNYYLTLDGLSAAGKRQMEQLMMSMFSVMLREGVM